MPAFGASGVFNLNAKQKKTTWQLVKPDGGVVMSCECKEQLEQHKTNLSQKLGVELSLVEKKLQYI